MSPTTPPPPATKWPRQSRRSPGSSPPLVGVPDERFGERVVAVIEARPGATLGTEDLRKVCKDKLTGIPRQVVTVDRVQRSPSGKPDYPWAKQVAVDAINNSTTPGV